MCVWLVFSVRHYVVMVETGTEENSGTDATVHITLFGTLGDSGKRYLVNNKEQNKKFRTGKVDTFIVEAVDLGRLENIIIGHDGKGEESAWFLEKVSVKEGADAKHKYIFTYGSWLQDNKDYGVVEVELYMDRMEKENSVLQKQDLNTVEDTQRSNEELEDTGDVNGDLGNKQGEDTNRSMEDIVTNGKEDQNREDEDPNQTENITSNADQNKVMENKTEDNRELNEDRTDGKSPSNEQNSVSQDQNGERNEQGGEEIKASLEDQNKANEDTNGKNTNVGSEGIKTPSDDPSKVNEDKGEEN
eukprot:XP_011445964.1 PREDICTED: lipoxygenase homology domain-containing protein 1-like [Crassostrea gigas]